MPDSAWWLYDFECFVRCSGPQPCGRNCFCLTCVALEFVPHELSIKLSWKLPCSRTGNNFSPVHSSSIFQFSLYSRLRLEVFPWTQPGVFWRRWRVCRLLTTSSFQKLWRDVSFYLSNFLSLCRFCVLLWGELCFYIRVLLRQMMYDGQIPEQLPFMSGHWHAPGNGWSRYSSDCWSANSMKCRCPQILQLIESFLATSRSVKVAVSQVAKHIITLTLTVYHFMATARAKGCSLSGARAMRSI